MILSPHPFTKCHKCKSESSRAYYSVQLDAPRPLCRSCTAKTVFKSRNAVYLVDNYTQSKDYSKILDQIESIMIHGQGSIASRLSYSQRYFGHLVRIKRHKKNEIEILSPIGAKKIQAPESTIPDPVSNDSPDPFIEICNATRQALAGGLPPEKAPEFIYKIRGPYSKILGFYYPHAVIIRCMRRTYTIPID